MVAYDTYDYPRYWRTRKYEHLSEVVAIREFLSTRGKLKKLADIGCGYGRLLPAYVDSAEKIILTDPSSRLLKIAKDVCKGENIEIKKGSVENAGDKIEKSSLDAVVLVRVLHHVEDLDKAFGSINSTLKKDGLLIVEFANKLHGKAIFKNIIKGNFTFPLDIFRIDRRSKKNKKEKSIAFYNYHPDEVKRILEENGFKVIEKRSVSNFRSSFIKKIIPLSILMYVEKKLQKPLASVNFGPSIFLYAKKKVTNNL